MSLLNYILKNQWLSPNKIKDIQNKRLRRLIKHAYYNVPYYNKLFSKNNLLPADIKTSDDLQKIPITTKDEIQKLSLDQIISKKVRIKNCKKEYTSGSTGKCLTIYLSKKDELLRNLMDFRSLLAMGCKIFDKVALIRTYRTYVSKKFEEKITYIFKRTISAYLPLKDQIYYLNEFKPNIIWGFPNCLKLITKFISDNKIIHLNPKVIFSSGEMLDDNTRHYLEKIFNVKVYDLYTSAELSITAWECERHNGYHINSDSIILEITKDGKRLKYGDEGEIVCTNLINYTMPLIRYNLEDIGVLSEKLCECGRCFPILKEIKGRCDDMIILRDRTILHNHILSVYIYNIPGLFQYKLIQEDFEKFKLFYSPKEIINDNLKRYIKNNFQKHINNIHINFIGVDSIPKDKSGKLRKFISLIPKSDMNN